MMRVSKKLLSICSMIIVVLANLTRVQAREFDFKGDGSLKLPAPSRKLNQQLPFQPVIGTVAGREANTCRLKVNWSYWGSTDCTGWLAREDVLVTSVDCMRSLHKESSTPQVAVGVEVTCSHMFGSGNTCFDPPVAAVTTTATHYYMPQRFEKGQHSLGIYVGIAVLKLHKAPETFTPPYNYTEAPCTDTTSFGVTTYGFPICTNPVSHAELPCRQKTTSGNATCTGAQQPLFDVSLRTATELENCYFWNGSPVIRDSDKKVIGVMSGGHASGNTVRIRAFPGLEGGGRNLDCAPDLGIGGVDIDCLVDQLELNGTVFSGA